MRGRGGRCASERLRIKGGLAADQSNFFKATYIPAGESTGGWRGLEGPHSSAVEYFWLQIPQSKNDGTRERGWCEGINKGLASIQVFQWILCACRIISKVPEFLSRSPEGDARDRRVNEPDADLFGFELLRFLGLNQILESHDSKRSLAIDTR